MEGASASRVLTGPGCFASARQAETETEAEAGTGAVAPAGGIRPAETSETDGRS